MLTVLSGAADVNAIFRKMDITLLVLADLLTAHFKAMPRDKCYILLSLKVHFSEFIACSVVRNVLGGIRLLD